MLDPEKYLGFLKLSGRSALILLIISSVILFGGNELLDKTGLLKVRDSMKIYIGIAWILSLSISIIEIINPLLKWISKKAEENKNLKTLQKRLHKLTPDEKEFLRFYILNNTRTQSAAYSNGVVNGLVAEKIVYRASQLAHYHNVFAYNIQQWAMDYLKENPDCLMG